MSASTGMEGSDGFNVMFPYLPEGLDEFVEKVDPELKRRGIFRRAYTGATLRDHSACHGLATNSSTAIKSNAPLSAQPAAFLSLHVSTALRSLHSVEAAGRSPKPLDYNEAIPDWPPTLLPDNSAYMNESITTTVAKQLGASFCRACMKA